MSSMILLSLHCFIERKILPVFRHVLPEQCDQKDWEECTKGYRWMASSLTLGDFQPNSVLPSKLKLYLNFCTFNLTSLFYASTLPLCSAKVVRKSA